MPQSGLQPDTPIKYMISHGTMTSVRREILHFPKLRRSRICPADADEVLSEENRRRFRLLKETPASGIEIVQMKYGNQLQNGTVYNFDEEYRLKLFRRLRNFVWEEPIHETVRLEPVVYDSDIVITHMPGTEPCGQKRSGKFPQTDRAGRRLSRRLYGMYAENCSWRERQGIFWKRKIISGQKFHPRTEVRMRLRKAVVWWPEPPDCEGAAVTFFKYTSKVIAGDGCSEICCELGYFYEETGDFEEAAVWYYNAAYETQPVLALRSSEEEPLRGLIRCYEQLGLPAQARGYAEELKHRQNEQTDN